jgi:hypothetical protein
MHFNNEVDIIPSTCTALLSRAGDGPLCCIASDYIEYIVMSIQFNVCNPMFVYDSTDLAADYRVGEMVHDMYYIILYVFILYIIYHYIYFS